MLAVSTRILTSNSASNTKISVVIQVRVYLLVAYNESLAMVTGIEFAYDKKLCNMRSLMLVLLRFILVIVYAVSQGLLPVITDL